MFKDAVLRTGFVTPDANAVFKNITGAYVNADCTMLSAMRAILPSRMEEHEEINFRYFDAVERLSMCDSLVGSIGNGQIWLTSVVGNQDGWKSKIKSCFDDVSEDEYAVGKWERAERAETFLEANKVNANIYMNYERKSVLIFMFPMRLPELHLIEAMMPSFLPWYFKNKPINDEEKELLVALGAKTSAPFKRVMEKLILKYNFREQRIRNQLHGFEGATYRNALEDAAYQLQDLRERLEGYKDSIADILQRISENNAKQIGLTKCLEECEDNSQVMEYFLTNKNINIIEANTNGYLLFYATGYCESFDPNIAENIINNPRSIVYRYVNENFDKSKMKDLFTAIFIDEEIKLRFCAAYEFLNSGRRVRGRSGYTYPVECDTYMPNPHIDFYSCIGDYERYIVDYLIEGNYIGAIEQCVQSNKSLNLGEANSTMARFCERVVDIANSATVYELPNGEIVTAQEAVKYIRANKKEG